MVDYVLELLRDARIDELEKHESDESVYYEEKTRKRIDYLKKKGEEMSNNNYFGIDEAKCPACGNDETTLINAKIEELSWVLANSIFTVETGEANKIRVKVSNRIAELVKLRDKIGEGE